MSTIPPVPPAWNVMLHSGDGDVDSYVVRAESELAAVAVAGVLHARSAWPGDPPEIAAVDVELWVTGTGQ